jgi:hypothetical protein
MYISCDEYAARAMRRKGLAGTETPGRKTGAMPPDPSPKALIFKLSCRARAPRRRGARTSHANRSFGLENYHPTY